MNLYIRYWTLPLTIAFISMTICFAGEQGRATLQYLGPAAEFNLGDMSYRWLTGHFTHIGWRHAGLNILGLTSIWFIYGRVISTRSWLAFLLICSVGISLCFNQLSPQAAYYVGLSGVLHGMLAAAVTVSLLTPGRRQNHTSAIIYRWDEIAVLVGLWGKIIFEQTIGAVPLTAALAGDAVVVDAHLYGACIGTGFALALHVYKFVNHKV